MDLAAEKAEFAKALAEFDAKHAEALASKPSSDWASMFETAVASVSTMLAPPKVSMNQAYEGAIAGRKVLEAHVANSNKPADISHYRGLQQAITNEFAAIIARDWRSRSKKYEPLTKAFIDSASNLIAAKERAEQTARDLELAAEVIGAFGKLLSVFGA
jgi:hypothetical protein